MAEQVHIASVAARRSAWLQKKGVNLDTVPPGYDFHVKALEEAHPKKDPAERMSALMVGAPPGTEAFQRLDQMLGAERAAVLRYLGSSVAQKEKDAREAWFEALGKGRELAPLVGAEMRAFGESLAKWKQLRAAPSALPRSIVQIDPATVEVPEDYKIVDVLDPANIDAVKGCIPSASEESVRNLSQPSNGRSPRELTRMIGSVNAANMFVSRRGMGACIPLTTPGYPVPALSSFARTIAVIGMDEADAKSWHRAIAQEVAAQGASQSLIVAPNGNGFEITYAVNLQRPYTLIYSSRFMPAGTYDAQRYRTVQRVAGFKSVSVVASGAANGVVTQEKPLISTPEEVLADEARARGTAALTRP